MAKLCCYPACRTIVRDGLNARCEKHRKPQRRLNGTSTGTKIFADKAARHGANRHIYDSARWKRISRKKKTMTPFCELCDPDGSKGIIAKIADHIIEIKDNPQLAFSISNIQSLCFDCHAIKTAEEVRKRTNPSNNKIRLQDL